MRKLITLLLLLPFYAFAQQGPIKLKQADTSSVGFATQAKISTLLTKAQVVAAYSPIAGSSSIVTVGTLVAGSIPYSLLTGTPTVPTAGNPSGLLTFTAANGSGANFLRNDGLHAIDSAVVRSVANSYTLSALQTKFNLYPLKTTTVAGFALSGNVTLATETYGTGLISGTYNGSAVATAKVDTAVVQTVLNFFPKGDTRYAKTSTNGAGANPTATAGSSAVNGSAITFMRSDAAPKVDSAVFATKALLGTYTPETRTVAGFPLNANVTLAALTATDATLTFSGSYTGATARTIGVNQGNSFTWTAPQTIQTTTANQLSVNYDGTHTGIFSTGSTGNLGITATGSVNLNSPVALNNGFSSSGARTFVTQTATSTATTGPVIGMSIGMTYNQASGSGANTDFLVNRTETALMSGTQLLEDLQVGGASKFNVDRTGLVTAVGNVTAPTFLASGSTAFSSSGTTATSNVSIYGTGAIGLTNASLLIGTASQVRFRAFMNGQSSTTISAGDSYIDFGIGKSPITMPSSGTTDWLAVSGALGFGTITNASAITINNTAVGYFGAASSAGTYNYSAYFGGVIRADFGSDATGDIWYRNSANGGSMTRLGIGATGTVLKVVSGLPSWQPQLQYTHTIFTPTTGGTVSLNNNQYNIINPAGALLALTVNLPSSPANNDVVYIKFTQNVTTVTYANGTVQDGITAPTAGGLTVLTYDSGTSIWY